MIEEIKEECGIVGIYGNESAAQLCYLGLYALQHRGQESAGITTAYNNKLHTYKNFGLVNRVFKNSKTFDSLKGKNAIGHNRYSTTGNSSNLANIQPIVVNFELGELALAHNGNLINATELRTEMEKDGHIFQSTSDSEVILHLIAKSHKENIVDRIIEALKIVKGAYSLLFLFEDKLIAARDPSGIRPFALGKLDNSFIVASETCAFDIVDAEYIRDIEPGEIVILDKNGKQTIKFAEPKKAHCVFEYIYFSRPDSIIYGNSCDKVRRKLGEELARENPVDADLVLAVPDSSNTIALGYSKESGIPFDIGILRNHYVGRTFIQPSQDLRDVKVKIKFNPIKGVIKDKRIILIDDSIVRGTTIKKLTKILKDAGAKEIHLRIGSPPIKHPCYYGMDFPSKEELIANTMNIEDTEKFLGVDSLRYLSTQGVLNCVDIPENYCHACFSGEYPIGINNEFKKDIFE